MNADQAFELEGLRVLAHADATAVQLTLTGASDAWSVHELFERIVATLELTRPSRSVDIDLRPLEFMNSATIGALVALVKSLDTQGVPTRLRFDAAVHWQRLNAQCLQVMARQLKHVRVDT